MEARDFSRVRLHEMKDYVGMTAKLEGQFRSYNRYNEKNGKISLELTVFVKEIQFYKEAIPHRNDIFLDGFICKTLVYRKTPSDREITDTILAVNRPYGKSDYLPCIFGVKRHVL